MALPYTRAAGGACLLLCLLAAADAQTSRCLMFGDRLPSAQPAVFRYCPHDAEVSCCTELEAASLFDTPHVWFNATQECATLIKNTMCHVCSKDQGDFFSPATGQVTLCYSQCVELHTICGDARLVEVGDPHYRNTATPQYKDVIRKVFRDGIALCEWLGYHWQQDPLDELILPCYRRHH